MTTFPSPRTALIIALIFTPPALHAQDLVLSRSGPGASLIELYSSEGCSSCPPAEAWLNHLKSAPGLWRDIFPVAFHVDYWDGLGWPDRFANAVLTQRQRDYATRLGQDSVYTPEFIVNGLEWRRGWLGDRLPEQGILAGDLTLSVQAGGRKIAAHYSPPTPAPDNDFTLNVALLGFNVVSDVKRGENGGQKLQHDFIVVGFRSLPLVPGSEGVFLNDPTDAPAVTAGETPGAIVAWISDGSGKIVQVTGGWLPKAPDRRSATAGASFWNP